MKKRVWVLPFLSAIFWASYRDSLGVVSYSHDARAAICAFSFSMFFLILGSSIPWTKLVP